MITTFLCSDLISNVHSTKGLINFDIDDDDVEEMRLDSTGLGIGGAPGANLHVQGNVSVSEKISVGGVAHSHSNLFIHGSITFEPVVIHSDQVLINSMNLADSSGGNLTLTLPYAGNAMGWVISVKKVSPNNEVWLRGGGRHIDGLKAIHLPASEMLPYIEVFSDGSDWHILNKIPVETVVAEDHLVGRWEFEENSGTIASDSSGKMNHGVFQGSADFSSNVATAVLGQGVVLDGIDDVIKVNSHQSLTFGDSNNDLPFSVSMWIYLPDASLRQGIMGKASSIDAGEYYVVMHQQKIYFRTVDDNRGAAIGIQSAAPALFDNAWYHIVGTYDGSGSHSGFSLYLDGQLHSTTQSNNESGYTAMEPTAEKLKLGARDIFFKGQLDDVRVYSKELSAKEVYILHQQGL